MTAASGGSWRAPETEEGTRIPNSLRRLRTHLLLPWGPPCAHSIAHLWTLPFLLPPVIGSQGPATGHPPRGPRDECVPQFAKISISSYPIRIREQIPEIPGNGKALLPSVCSSVSGYCWQRHPYWRGVWERPEEGSQARPGDLSTLQRLLSS